VSVPTDLRYTQDHEWVRLDGSEATVGITQYAADQLGDIVFVELPDVGRELVGAKPFGVVESVKAVSDLYAPVAGEVIAINDALAGSPELVNSDPYGEGWMVRITVTDPDEVEDLLDADAYDALVAAG
jgi:glycine cleavage system H protein